MPQNRRWSPYRAPIGNQELFLMHGFNQSKKTMETHTHTTQTLKIHKHKRPQVPTRVISDIT